MTFEVEVSETFHGAVRVTAGSELEARDFALERVEKHGVCEKRNVTYSCGYVREVKDDG